MDNENRTEMDDIQIIKLTNSEVTTVLNLNSWMGKWSFKELIFRGKVFRVGNTMGIFIKRI